MHFFVDKNGLTKVCIRESDGAGNIKEIQQRQQDDGKVPIPYVNVIDDFIKNNELNDNEVRSNINKAQEAKPLYDDRNAKYAELASSNDYKSILEDIGVNVETLPDGTYSISHYNPNLGEYTINDLGISENILLSNVSIIKGDANFANSNATQLPNLLEVKGTFGFEGSSIRDIRNLKLINGYEIKFE